MQVLNFRGDKFFGKISASRILQKLKSLVKLNRFTVYMDHTVQKA